MISQTIEQFNFNPANYSDLPKLDKNEGTRGNQIEQFCDTYSPLVIMGLAVSYILIMSGIILGLYSSETALKILFGMVALLFLPTFLIFAVMWIVAWRMGSNLEQAQRTKLAMQLTSLSTPQIDQILAQPNITEKASLVAKDELLRRLRTPVSIV